MFKVLLFLLLFSVAGANASQTSCEAPCYSPCNIKGNISYNTGEKIYHLPECPNYCDVVMRFEYGERCFCTEDEAIQAGWRKANNCP